MSSPHCPVVLSYGMGVESTAILLRWIFEPATRPCDLADLIVITAQVGDEYRDTGRDVETHALPLLRQHGIRYVQVARHGAHEADGIAVLSDTRQPATIHLDGDYKLSDELRRNGTIPLTGGVHRCALKFKAFVIEKWLDDSLCLPAHHAIGYNSDETARIENSEYAAAKRRQREARVAFGFNADEQARIQRAGEYDGLRADKNTSYTRTAFYPLLEWGWSRQCCVEYIHDRLDVVWNKSACVFCPFAHNRQNAPDLIARHHRHPDQVAEAMLLEHVSLSLNPRAALYKDKSLIEITERAGNTAAVELYRRLLMQPFAAYRVRRIYSAKAKADRAVEQTAMFPGLTQAGAELRALAATVGAPVEDIRGIPYLYRERRRNAYPAREEFFTIAPALVPDKARYGIARFNARWSQGTLF